MLVSGLARLVGMVPLTGFVLAGILGILAVVAWLAVAQASMPVAGTLDATALVLFTLIWGVGMVAMMFPSLVPLVYAVTVSARKSSEDRQAPRFLPRVAGFTRAGPFIGGYVAVWTLVGVAFYLAIASLELVGVSVGMGVFGFWAARGLIATG